MLIFPTLFVDFQRPIRKTVQGPREGDIQLSNPSLFLCFTQIFIVLFFQETLMLGTSLNGDHHGHSVHSGHQAGGSNNSQDDLKLPSRKEKQSILRLYAKKLGLNERGCYLAVILAFFILFLMLIILAMAITWPGTCFINTYFL